MRFSLGLGVSSSSRLVLLGCALLSQSCDALWSSFARDNPENCVTSAAGCAADEICDLPRQICVSALRIDSVSPALASSRGGTAMTLRGQRFVAGATVLVDDQPASDVVVVSPEELRFTLPASTRGLWHVPIAVQNPSQHRSERRDLFAYFAETLSFESHAIAVGGLPIGVASGDWNGDQKLDLAVITIPSSGVQLLQGDGSGGFSAAGSLAVGSATMTTQHILSLDSNRDGSRDLLVAAGGSLTLFLGDGQGGFPSRRVLYTATGSNRLRALAVGDYDADGRPDIVLTDALSDNSSGDVVLIVNGGDDSYTATSLIDSGKPARSLAIVDLTADGRSDVVVGMEDTRVSLWRNDGGQARTRFDLPSAGCSAGSVAVGDLNRDGQPDLLLRCDTALRSLLNQGSAQFIAQPDLPTTTATSPTLVLAELNGDGHLDAGLGRGAAVGDSQVVGLLGDGAGGFAAPQEIAAYSTTQLSVGHVLHAADWDGDGKTDVLSLSTMSSQPCRLLLNRSR